MPCGRHGHGKFRDHRSAGCNNIPCQLQIFLRMQPCQTAAENGDRLPARIHGAAVNNSVDADCQTADNHPFCVCCRFCQMPCHLFPVMGNMPRPYHGNGVGRCFRRDRAADIETDRRIMDLTQRFGVGFIAPDQNRNAATFDETQFFFQINMVCPMIKFVRQRFADPGDPGKFRFGKREDILHGVHKFLQRCQPHRSDAAEHVQNKIRLPFSHGTLR